MEFRSSDPGAVQFGNFINYYQFNSAEERLKLLPKDVDIWLPNASLDVKGTATKPYLVLDVGCNSGAFTQLLWQHLNSCTGRTVYMLGIDIDSSLIRRAQEEQTPDMVEHIKYASLDIMQEQSSSALLQSFVTTYKRQRFDAVCCFSITMWIHMNHHDKGLLQFLRRMTEWSELFVVEPQSWKCYQTAERRLKKSGEIFPLFSQLQWRSDVEQQIQSYLEVQLGRRKVFECMPTKWKRHICFYRSSDFDTNI